MMDSPFPHFILFKHFKLFVEPTANKQTPMGMLQKKVSDWQTIQEAWIHSSMVIMLSSRKSSLTAIINILLYYLHGIVIQDKYCDKPYFMLYSLIWVWHSQAAVPMFRTFLQ